MNQTDLQAEVFLRNLQERDKQQKMRKIDSGISPTAKMNVKKQPNHYELSLEIDELKKRKNKDSEDIKLLKVELQKMEVIYKRYKEALSDKGSRLAGFNIAQALPFSLGDDLNEVAGWLSTEDLLIETAKIKNMLQKEILQSKKQSAQDQKRALVEEQIKSPQNHGTPAPSRSKPRPQVCNNCTISDSPSKNLDHSFLTGHAKSNLRLQLASLKERHTLLERQLVEKQEELSKLQAKTSDQAKLQAREELNSAMTVLKHVKKKAGAGFYDVEYQSLIEEIQLIHRGEKKEEPASSPRASVNLGNIVVKTGEFDGQGTPRSIGGRATSQQNGLLSSKSPNVDEKSPNFKRSRSNSKDEQIEDPAKVQQSELFDLQAKFNNLQSELALSDKDFERKLTERLRDEIKQNRAKLDEEFRKELKQEKIRIMTQAIREKEDLKNENKQLGYEIQRLKILMRHGGASIGAMGAAQLALMSQEHHKQ